MAGFSKLFNTMWGGSLYGRFEASAVFMVLLSLADRDGHVDMTPEAIAGTTGWPLEFINQGIGELEAPDPRSRTPDENGRRLVPLDDHRAWGWLITNYAKYRDEQRSQERREYLREAQRRRRAKLSTSVNKSTNVNRNQPIAEAEAEAEADSRKQIAEASNTVATLHTQAHANEFEIFKTIYPKRSGSQPWNKAYKALSARLAGGVVWGEIEAGALRYAQWCRETGKIGTEFVMQAVRFLGPEQQFLLAWDLPTTKAESRLDGNLDAMERAKQELFGEH